MEGQQQRHLVIIEGPMEGRSYPLHGMVTTLGRASDNSIVFDSARISRHHAEIRLLPQGAVVEDMDSTNGTWVNNHRLTDPWPLSSGDLIRLADYVTLRYVVEGVPRFEHIGPAFIEGNRMVLDESAAGSVPEYEEIPSGADAYGPVSQDDDAAPRDTVSLPEPVESQERPQSLYFVIGILVVLICLCVAAAVYLWFAPVTFWERIFDLFGIPMPTSSLSMVLLKFYQRC